MTATDCTGTWTPASVPADNSDLRVFSCSGCTAWWVHIGQHAVTIEAGQATTAEDAVRLAIADKATNQ